MRKELIIASVVEFIRSIPPRITNDEGPRWRRSASYDLSAKKEAFSQGPFKWETGPKKGPYLFENEGGDVEAV
jgi:hypothetical protein